MYKLKTLTHSMLISENYDILKKKKNSIIKMSTFKKHMPIL